MKLVHLKIIMIAIFFSILNISITESSVELIDGLVKEKKGNIGNSINDVIIIKNTGDSPEEVKIYQTDYQFQADGHSIYGTPGTSKRSNAKWITIPLSHVVIQPKSSEQINLIINIPSGNLSGTYWSMIMVESISTVPVQISNDKKIFTVVPTFRYGVQIVTHIGETGDRSLKFAGANLFKDHQKRMLQIDVQNDGERFLHPSLSVKLYDPRGKMIHEFKGEKLRTYPGTSVRFNFDLTDIQAGNYKAVIIADCGSDDIFGATYNLSCEK